jgi:hypothetical protein
VKPVFKHLKKIFAAGILGFIAFAPPGTMIVAGIFALGLLGETRFFLGLIAAMILLAVYGFVFRKRILGSRAAQKILGKLKIKADAD